jgi:phosphohistidine phosphatase
MLSVSQLSSNLTSQGIGIMKKIHLLRHAKSSWDDASLADVDRSLNERGIRTCHFMAHHIYKAGCRFDNVFCSPAVRAQSTIELISRCIPEADVQWQIDEELYSFDSENLLEWCRSLDESIFEVSIIGHNPALTDFCDELSHGNIENIPTCGYVQLTANKECRWREISEGSFELTTFLRPKNLMK